MVFNQTVINGATLLGTSLTLFALALSGLFKRKWQFIALVISGFVFLVMALIEFWVPLF